MIDSHFKGEKTSGSSCFALFHLGFRIEFLIGKEICYLVDIKNVHNSALWDIGKYNVEIL
jgi:hypothetical protein